MDHNVLKAMARPADSDLDKMAREAARRTAITVGVKGDVIAEKEIYRAIVSVANGYAEALRSANT